MIWAVELVLFAVLIGAAVLALAVRDLLASVALLATFSLFAALLFTGLQAVDVALVEAALGAGVTGVLFISVVLITSRKAAGPDGWRRNLVVLPVVMAFFGLMVFASTGLPDRGDPDSPAQLGVSRAYITDSVTDSETPNVVTAILADYRSQDTLGETLVILTAALAAVAVVLAGRDNDDADEADDDPDEGERDRRGQG